MTDNGEHSFDGYEKLDTARGIDSIKGSILEILEADTENKL